MQQHSNVNNQAGFSLIELMVAMTVMLVVAGAVTSLLKDSMKSSIATYEMTDAQDNVRIAQEYINRDLLDAGDGLNSLSNIRLTSGFVTNYLSLNASIDLTHFGMLTSDDNVPAPTTIPQPTPSPASTIRSVPLLTDRISMLTQDKNFASITPVAIDATGANITLTAGQETQFTIGEIYFLTSTAGATFCTIKDITGVGGATPKLNFANSDVYGLNVTGATGQIRTVANGGATSLIRMQIIHYYINSTGLLMRRVFGVKGKGFSETPIAEHIVSMQFRYSLKADPGGAVLQPVRLLTSAQQLKVRQVETTVIAETPHSIGITQNSGMGQITMTTSTSVRNMQFKCEPTMGGC